MLEFFAGPWGPLLIFGLRVVDVSMATVRMLMVVRGASSWRRFEIGAMA